MKKWIAWDLANEHREKYFKATSEKEKKHHLKEMHRWLNIYKAS